MKYAVKIGSGAMIGISGYITIGSGVQNGGGAHTVTHTTG
jgi:hypothetical protein